MLCNTFLSLQFIVGSLSHLVGHSCPKYLSLPEWPEEEADHEARVPATVCGFVVCCSHCVS